MAKGGGNSGGRGERGPGRSSGRGPNYRRPGGGGGGTGGNTGGTRHKSSSVEGTPMITVVYGIAAAIGLVIVGMGAFFAHGYGLL